MTLTLSTGAEDETPEPVSVGRTGRAGRRAGQLRAQGPETPRSWAVVELHPDGSLGLPQMVLAGDPLEATTTALRGVTSPSATAPDITPGLEAQLGRCLAAEGRLADAVRVLTVGALKATSSPARTSCLGQLALAEAYLGDLRRATEHSDHVLAGTDTCGDAALAQALVAKARVHLHRGELDDSRRCLDLTTSASLLGAEPWLATNRLLVEAELLIAEGQADAATRLLANALASGSLVSASSWLSDVLATARADSLLAAGEPHRALAAVTPPPRRAVVAATVVAAEARREIGDVRGSHAVLQTVVEDVELATVALQVRALLLESRLAGDRHDAERSRLLLDRALQVADAEQLRSLVTRARPWLRRVVDQDPTLARAHRDLFTGFDAGPVAAGPGVPPLAHDASAEEGALLTDREGQVLDLLAQMYSTDEIAAELYVSANTVKTHLKGIFGKLGVNRRADAVRRGRQLGLC